MTGIFLRWAFAFALLVATYNPTPWNYANWVQGNFQTQMPVAVLLGLLLLVGYIIYVRATMRSIGVAGMALVGAVVAASVWVLHDWGLLQLAGADIRTWLAIFALSVVLGIGLSWSLVRRALSGQVDIDDVEE